jgi:CRP/FNR family transcriptional regulator, cyclic AMP receptor protein
MDRGEPLPAVLAPRMAEGSFYQALAPDERDLLRSAGSERGYRAGYMLTLEGQPESEVMVMLSGWAKATFVTADGAQVVLRLYGPGDIFSSEGSIRRETVIALTMCHALLIPARRFAELAARPGVSRIFTATLTQRMHAADELMKLRHTAPDVGVARVLLDLAERAGTGRPGILSMPVDLSQEDLASWLGSSRSTIARTLRSLRRRGIIDTGYRTVTITDPEALRRLAGASR